MKPGEMQKTGIQKPESHDRIFPGFLASCISMSWRAGAKPPLDIIIAEAAATITAAAEANENPRFAC